MHRFEVRFRSFSDVQEFVFWATKQPFEITVTNGRHTVDAKSLMVMFSLDYSRPMQACAHCTAEEFSRLLREQKPFVTV